MDWAHHSLGSDAKFLPDLLTILVVFSLPTVRHHLAS